MPTARPTIEATRRRGFVAVLGLVLAVLGAAPASNAEAAAPARARVIVRLADGVDARAEAAAVARAGGRVTEVYGHVFPGFAAEVPVTARDALARRPDVVAVTPDHLALPSLTSGEQTGATWGLDRIDERRRVLDRTYRYPGTGSGVRAYVIDSGILADHVDLAGRVVGGRTGVFDGRGTNDCNGHGTHVAGTIGGTTWGVAKDVTLVPLRVFGCTGGASYSTIIAALDWVVANHPSGGRGVVNMSLGGPADANLDTAVARTVSAGIPVVVAAGNDGKNACDYSPARAPSAVTVGATTSSDARSSFSNFGTCLDLFAPGSSITSAWSTSTTATKAISGTSMASPHAAGALALVLEADPTLGAATAADRLIAAATVGVIGSTGTGSPNLLLHVAAAPVVTPLTVATSELPRGTVGTAYSAALTTSGGTGSATWTLTGGSLPAGLALSSNGTISGTPTAATGASGSSLTVTATDGTTTASSTLTLVIDPAPVAATVDGQVRVALASGKWLAADATVTVTDAVGPRAGVRVEGRWYRDGRLLRSSSGTTGSNGTVAFSSGTVKVRTGTLSFCIDRLSGTGVETRTYAPSERCGTVTK